MKLKNRAYKQYSDYHLLNKWWQSYSMDHAPDSRYLSDTGLVIEDEKNNPVAMVFMYHTNSSVCLSEFFTVNPYINKKKKDATLNYMIKVIKNWAIFNKYKLIYVSTNIKKYISRLEKEGFIVADKNMVHCFCFLS